MRTSLNEIREIEEHLLKQHSPEEDLLFQARLILYPSLKEKVLWQQKVYELVRAYGRKKLREEIEEVHQKLFSAPEHKSFREKIFKRSGSNICIKKYWDQGTIRYYYYYAAGRGAILYR